VTSSRAPVRPTKRCLDDLDLPFPSVEQPLHALTHPIIAKAQQVPVEVAARGAERVLLARDRVWFKVKIGTDRAVVTELDPATEERAEITEAQAWWWIGAAGTRKQDSSTDFYTALAAECTRAGKGTGAATSTHLLPADIDIRRLAGELVYRSVLGIRTLVRGLIARSIRNGEIWTATLRSHTISARVHARDGAAYLAIGAEGFLDPRILAVILAAVPGVASDDWIPEPKGAFGLEPRPGEILYSTLIPPEAQQAILDEFPDDES
jgi:hypothetical protein